MKKLGIIGGLGPMATAHFMRLVTQMSDAATDQEHIEILLHSRPRIPDRTCYILDKNSENPVPQMIEVGKGLARCGAEIIAVPCITAHYFQKELEESIGVPILNAVKETALCLQNGGIQTVGIMATDGTVRSGLFQNVLGVNGMDWILPDRQRQRQVMHVIYENVKAGKPAEMCLFQDVAKSLFHSGAQVILLACTELSLVGRDNGLGAGYLDVMEVLARKAVLSCGNLKKEYEKLV